MKPLEKAVRNAFLKKSRRKMLLESLLCARPVAFVVEHRSGRSDDSQIRRK
jgi:hypothetical protein